MRRWPRRSTGLLPPGRPDAGAGECLRGALRRHATCGRGGKRFRPALVVGAFRALGGDVRDSPARCSTVAAAFELLHTAFVIHDDLIDGDTVRRGVPNVAGEFRLRADGDDSAIPGRYRRHPRRRDLLLHEAQRIVATIADVTCLCATGSSISWTRPSSSRRRVSWPTSSTLLRPGSDVRRSSRWSPTRPRRTSFSAPLRAGAAARGFADDVTTARVAPAGRHSGSPICSSTTSSGPSAPRRRRGATPVADLVASPAHPAGGAGPRMRTSWAAVSDTIALARTGPVALREAAERARRERSRSRTEALVRELLDDVRADAFDPPPGLGRLLADCAAGVEGRIREHGPVGPTGLDLYDDAAQDAAAAVIARYSDIVRHGPPPARPARAAHVRNSTAWSAWPTRSWTAPRRRGPACRRAAWRAHWIGSRPRPSQPSPRASAPTSSSTPRPRPHAACGIGEALVRPFFSVHAHRSVPTSAHDDSLRTTSTYGSAEEVARPHVPPGCS